MQIQRKNKLRYGFSTGACASASAKIALLSIINNKPIKDKVSVWFPENKYYKFKAEKVELISENKAMAIVKKFAGDDPDITDGALIGAIVKYEKSNNLKIEITGGKGVGKVTKPGLPVKVGSHAINPVPKLMIKKNIKEVVSSGNIWVEIFVVNGEKLAKKTLNPKLGIIGGISILGTTGIVKPLSIQAWLDTIKVEMNVALHQGIKEVVLVTGRTTENILKKNYNFKDEAFVTVGDHVGFSLKEAVNKGFKKIIFAGMFGKFTKVASGEFQTHVKNSTLTMKKILIFFKETNIKDESFEKIILNSVTARNVFEEAVKRSYFDFLNLICKRVCENCYKYISGKIPVKTILVDYKGEIVAEAEKN